MRGRWIAVWGVIGVVGLLSQALLRLTPLAVEAVRGELTTLQWVVMIAWVVLNAHAEGYRGFHKKFSPRVIARAQYLAANPSPVRAVFAPLFCMSLFGASRRGMIVARTVLGGIVVLVLIVRALSQPWRGIVDAGVVVGLGLGMLSLMYFAVRALMGHPPAIDPDLPEGEAAAASPAGAQ